MSFNGRRSVPHPVNEPVKSYAPGSPERAELKARLQAMAAETADIPLVIDGQAVRTGHTDTVVMPHAHLDLAIPIITDPYFGCAAERCLSGSVLVPLAHAHRAHRGPMARH